MRSGFDPSKLSQADLMRLSLVFRTWRRHAFDIPPPDYAPGHRAPQARRTLGRAIGVLVSCHT